MIRAWSIGAWVSKWLDTGINKSDWSAFLMETQLERKPAAPSFMTGSTSAGHHRKNTGKGRCYRPDTWETFYHIYTLLRLISVQVKQVWRGGGPCFTKGSVLMASRCLWARNSTPTAPQGLLIGPQAKINAQELQRRRFVMHIWGGLVYLGKAA